MIHYHSQNLAHTGEFMELKSDIPLPSTKSYALGATKYPFAKMQVGDSFGIESGRHKLVRSAVCNRHLKYPERFAIRQHEGEWRCWRIA